MLKCSIKPFCCIPDLSKGDPVVNMVMKHQAGISAGLTKPPDKIWFHLGFPGVIQQQLATQTPADKNIVPKFCLKADACLYPMRTVTF